MGKVSHPRGLCVMIRRRSAIEPAIDDIKTDGKLDWRWLNGALGDAMHAVLRVHRSQLADFFTPRFSSLCSASNLLRRLQPDLIGAPIQIP